MPRRNDARAGGGAGSAVGARLEAVSPRCNSFAARAHGFAGELGAGISFKCEPASVVCMGQMTRDYGRTIGFEVAVDGLTKLT
jgi:hypothetical protein